MANTIGIFDNFEQSNDLFNIWMQHKQEEEVKRLQPLADLLLDNVVWPSVLAKKDEIFATLKSKCGSAKFAQDLEVPIWSFSDVHGYPGHRENPERSRQIDENGWRQCVEFHHVASIISEAPLYSVVKKTDFCHQLAQRFGRDFTITLSNTNAVEEIDPSGETFYRHTANLMLNYFPNGLPEYHKEMRTKWEETFHARVRPDLAVGDMLILQGAGICVHGRCNFTLASPASLRPWVRRISDSLLEFERAY